jgi:pyridoxamine 5'-phosphate oxidase
VIAGREWLEKNVEDTTQRFAPMGEAIPRPAHWGGYRMVPDTFEFWQGRPSRLHDRIRYQRNPGAQATGAPTWRIERLAP